MGCRRLGDPVSNSATWRISPIFCRSIEKHWPHYGVTQNMKNPPIIYLIAAGLSISLASHADEANKGKGQITEFWKLDKDRDKAISKEEAGAEIWTRIGKLDRNQDGKIAGAEFVRPEGGAAPGGKTKAKAKPGDFMKRYDKNGDGEISKQEAGPQMWAQLSKLDKNSDSSVSKEEFAANRAASPNIFPKQGIAVIWMVQHGGFPGEGKEAHGVFKNWALKNLGVRN